jgi:hypothetical protein
MASPPSIFLPGCHPPRSRPRETTRSVRWERWLNACTSMRVTEICRG